MSRQFDFFILVLLLIVRGIPHRVGAIISFNGNYDIHQLTQHTQLIHGNVLSVNY